MNCDGVGATYLGESRCHFLVWAPLAQKVDVRLLAPLTSRLGKGGQRGVERLAPLVRDDRGYHHGTLEGVEPGALYLYRLTPLTSPISKGGERGVDRPDPASRSQPQGVHGPSQVVDTRFPWEDRGWTGIRLPDYIIYELHVGTFTAEGTFDAIIPYLDELKDLGVTAIELMPVAQFPGGRNWGYDGVNAFAAHHSYGGLPGLQRLVNACHQKGLAVVLDVVYNHFGPEGNYLTDFGPYFTRRYSTPWGAALNFDTADSDDVRRFFIENALYWITDCHIDALRLDAVHAILDHSPRTFLEELAAAVHQRAERLGRRVYAIAESPDNDARLITDPALGGYGMDGQWSDDFHHCLHTLLTGEHNGYYQDYGQVRHLVKAFREGFAYSGEYSPFRRRRHGTPARNVPAHRFVVCAQNHDQAGNRMRGERLSQLVSFEALKVAAGLVLLSPFVPLLFMGEEYGETAPFPYFISHTDPELVEAVRQGRREEFAAFQPFDSAQGERVEPPDPQDEATFRQAKLDHHLRGRGHHATLLGFYRELIRLRQTIPALAQLSKETLEVVGYEQPRVLFFRRWRQSSEAVAVFDFGLARGSEAVRPSGAVVPLPPGRWRKALDSAEERWGGPGSPIAQELASEGEAVLRLSPESFVLFVREEDS